MILNALYDQVDGLLRKGTLRRVERNDAAIGAEWSVGLYSVQLRPTGPRPMYLKLNRKGGRKRSLFFYDVHDVAVEIAEAIADHFQDGRNAR